MSNLTEREKEVLKMLCLPNKQIARKMGLKLCTVKTYIVKLFNKFPFSTNRAGIVIEAVKQNIIKVEEIITE